VWTNNNARWKWKDIDEMSEEEQAKTEKKRKLRVSLRQWVLFFLFPYFSP
jgi:hypothetical protein